VCLKVIFFLSHTRQRVAFFFFVSFFSSTLICCYL
jgi:hypothetical protein